eukprot:707708-Rhodomonas_salina.8
MEGTAVGDAGALGAASLPESAPEHTHLSLRALPAFPPPPVSARSQRTHCTQHAARRTQHRHGCRHESLALACSRAGSPASTAP